jgi:adenosine deaminase
MSVENFIRAMPKVELHVHLEGAFQRETLLMLAEQNDIAATLKARQYTDYVQQIDKPETTRHEELARVYAHWVRYPEDLTRVVYDLGLALAQQNVRYAEVYVNAAIYTDNGMTFEAFLEALNDGRNRVERAWKTRMNWILTIPRDRPRKGDDIAKWVTSAAARKGNVVGMGLGVRTEQREEIHPAAQFTKPFVTVEKKNMGRVGYGRSFTQSETMLEMLPALNPQRVVDTWGLAWDANTVQALNEQQALLVVTPVREMRIGRIQRYAEYPLREMVDQVQVLIGAGLPSLYKTTLTDEYRAAVQECGLGTDELMQMVLRGIARSFLNDEEKAALTTEFTAAFAQLSQEHLANA